MNRIAHVSLVVRDYDEALDFYLQKLDFQVLEDTGLGEGKRWITIRPNGATDFSIVLAKASNAQQLRWVGDQTGGRVFLFLYTDDFQRDYRKLVNRGVEFVRDPKTESYGIVAVFKDLYGNLWDLIQPSGTNRGVTRPG